MRIQNTADSHSPRSVDRSVRVVVYSCYWTLRVYVLFSALLMSVGTPVYSSAPTSPDVMLYFAHIFLVCHIL